MNKHYAINDLKQRYFKSLIISASVLLIVILGSIATVFATSVPCTIVDGEIEYNFNLMSPEEKKIVEKAMDDGMPALDADDYLIYTDGQFLVQRVVDLEIDYNGTIQTTSAIIGQSLQTALDTAQIEYNEKDLFEPSLSEIITGDSSVSILTYNNVTLIDDENTYELELYNSTVQDVLDELNINLEEKDTITPDVETVLSAENEIIIDRACDVTLIINKEEEIYATQAETIQDLLEEIEIELADGESVNFELDTAITDGMEIEIKLYEEVDVVYSQVVKYTTTYIADSSMTTDESYVKTSGKNGSADLTYTQVYLGGELVDEIFVEKTVTSKAVNEVIVKGTISTDENSSSGTFVDLYGNTVVYESVTVGECTAYCEPGGITSLGWDAQIGVVAVNPDVIPYGTKLYITSGSIVYGYAIAGDTGGAALSNRILIDVYYDDEDEMWDFGRRDMTVYILS